MHDPVADTDEAKHEYGVDLTAWAKLPKAAAIVAAVAHDEFRKRPLSDYVSAMQPGGLLVDVKSLFDEAQLRALGVAVWRL